MRILMVAHYTNLLNETGNCRFSYICEELSKNQNNNIELITSTFSHESKKQRTTEKFGYIKNNFKITSVYEPNYRKNVCLKRFYSSYVMAKNLKKYLLNLEYKPDVIYCAVPSLDVAKVSAQYAKNNNIKFIIDVQDLWPEAFKMVFNIPVLSNLIFFPMKRKANYIYKNADDIVAVSDTYLNRAKSVNQKARYKLSIFLGTDLDFFDKLKNNSSLKKKNEIINVVYVGTLGHSYNIKCIIDALKILREKNINNICFTIMGDGPLKQEFEDYAKEYGVNCNFTGRLDYDKMVEILCNCDIAVNPITKGAAQSIINKVGDYAAAELPVISTQECPEYRKIVEKYNIGFNCSNEDIKNLAEKIEILYNDKNLRKKMGKNNRKLAEEKFDRKTTYKKIFEMIGE